jgi:hypothetical protein
MVAAGQVHEPVHGQVTTCAWPSAACLQCAWGQVTEEVRHSGVGSSLTGCCMPPAGYGPEDQGYFSLELTYNYGKVSTLCSRISCLCKPRHSRFSGYLRLVDRKPMLLWACRTRMMLAKVRQPLPQYLEACYATECSCGTRFCSVNQVSTLLAGFGHFAVAVPDVYKAVDDIKAAGELHSSGSGPTSTMYIAFSHRQVHAAAGVCCWANRPAHTGTAQNGCRRLTGGTVTRDAGPVKGGSTEIAFVEVCVQHAPWLSTAAALVLLPHASTQLARCETYHVVWRHRTQQATSTS